VFCSKRGTTFDITNADKAFKRVLKHAELPLHFTPHCLRHTFASLLLQQGESPAYVQRQLGHSSIQLTVDTYERWLPMGTRPRSIASTTRVREQVVANSVFGGTGVSEVPELTWSRGRELNPRPTDYESRAGANAAGSSEPNRPIQRGFRVTPMPDDPRWTS
jgi:hypothetical protein